MAECDRRHHPYDGVCAPAWIEKLSIACVRGDYGLCEWPLCGCPCHDNPGCRDEDGTLLEHPHPDRVALVAKGSGSDDE